MTTPAGSADYKVDSAGNAIIVPGGTSLVIGDGTANIDYILKFDGETSDGVITWMEDEDYLKFDDAVLMASTAPIYFRDTAIHIASLDDGHLDLTADTSIDLNSATGVDHINELTGDHGVVIDTSTTIKDGDVASTTFTIAAHTLAEAEFHYLDGIDQAVKTTDAVQFARASIVGTSDAVELTVKQYAAQTANLASFTTSADAEVFSIEKDGLLRQDLTVYSEYYSDLTSAKPAVSAPDYDAFKNNTKAYAFDKATDQGLHVILHVPHECKLNSTVDVHVHWSPKTAGDGSTQVRWAFEYTRARLDTSAQFGATTVISAGDVASTNAFEHQMCTIGTIANIYPGEVIVGYFYRDADGTSGTDDYDDDAFGIGLGMHYISDTLGTRTYNEAGHADK